MRGRERIAKGRVSVKHEVKSEKARLQISGPIMSEEKLATMGGARSTTGAGRTSGTSNAHSVWHKASKKTQGPRSRHRRDGRLRGDLDGGDHVS